MAEDNPLPSIPAPTAFASKHRVLIGCLVVVVVILGLLSTFLGYSYKKEVKLNITLSTENDTLRKQVNTHTDTTMVVQPTVVNGQVAYTTTTHTTNDTSESSEATHSQSVSIVTKTVTVIEKDFVTFGFGMNLSQDYILLGQKDLLTLPFGIGHIGIALMPDISSIKRSAGLITWKP